MKVYAELPGWFKVPTPLGTYNPDWAVVIHFAAIAAGDAPARFVQATKLEDVLAQGGG